MIQYTFVGRETSFACSRGKETLTNACFDNQVAKHMPQGNDPNQPGGHLRKPHLYGADHGGRVGACMRPQLAEQGIDCIY